MNTQGNYSFEVHTYAPELNKVFYKGVNITKYIHRDYLTLLNKDYRGNVKLIRMVLNYKTYYHHIEIKLSSKVSDNVREFGGGFDDYKQAIQFIRDREKWFNNGCNRQVKFIFKRAIKF